MIPFEKMKFTLPSLLAVAFSLIFSVRAHAMPDPKTLETGWLWDTYFSSFTSATSQTVDPAGFGTVGYSSRTANIVGFSYTIYALGGVANYTVTQTTKTPNTATYPTSFNSDAPFGLASTTATFQTSSLITIPSGLAYNGTFQGLTINPYFTFSGLSSAATYYVWIELGRQRKP